MKAPQKEHSAQDRRIAFKALQEAAAAVAALRSPRGREARETIDWIHAASEALQFELG